MKVYHLTLEFDLIDKPSWVNPFREKYKEPYNYHITLKYPTIINESRLAELKNEIKKIARTHKTLMVEFDKYFFDKTSNGNLIMVSAKHNKELLDLQKDVFVKLNKYGKTTQNNYKKFENNFKPHIALARKLSDKTYLRAKSQLEKSIYCKAIVTKLALTIVNEGSSVEDVVNPINTYYFYLQSGS